MPRTSSRRSLQAGLLATALFLTGCATNWDQFATTAPPPTTTTPSPSPDPNTASPTPGPTGNAETVVPGWIQPTGDAPTTADGFYNQTITWGSCQQTTFECATIWAPMDWDNPGDGAITLALARVPATGDGGATHLGSLLSNPGGPGGSGIDFLDYFSRLVSPSVAAAYDLVSFDPRGVNLSTPVQCGTDEELNEYFLTDYQYNSQADVDNAVAKTQEFGQRCLEETGPALGFFDTVSAAKDMDLMRALLGDEKLSYLGYSYGTQLGATYAGLFPQNVGRLVLDGAVDVSLSSDEMTKQQAAGFEQAFRSYVEDCMTSTSCPLTGSVDDGMNQIQQLVKDNEANPLPTGNPDEPLNGTLTYYGIIVAMYDDESWPVLTEALTDAIQKGDGAYLLYLANFYLSRDDSGRYTDNSMVAFGAINCLDAPTTLRTYDEMLQWRDEVAQVAPIVADDFAMGTGCEGWPFPNRITPAAITADGAAPIVVIGTTGDPATPYAWAQALASQLSSGVLVTWNGEGHTAYGRSNDCIRTAVDQYFLDGTVPQDGLTC